METVIEEGTPAFGVEGRHKGGMTALRASAAGRRRGRQSSDWQTGATGAGRPAWCSICEVTAIDAGGLGALLRLRQTAGGHGAAVTIVAAAPRVRRVLQLTRLDGVFGLSSGRTPSCDPRGRRRLLCRCA